MTRRILIAATGLVAGVAAAVAFGPTSDAVEEAGPTTTTSTTLATPTWSGSAEILAAPAVVVPETIQFDPPFVEIRYRVDTVSPGGGENTNARPVLPTSWTLLTSSGDISALTDPAARRVIFGVPVGFTRSQIEGLRLDTYMLRVPIQVPFTPTPEDFAAHEVIPGVTARLDTFLEQGTGAVVRVALGGDAPGLAAELSVAGAGPGWTAASSNFGGGGRWTLTLETETIPEQLDMLVRGVALVQLDSGASTDLHGVPDE